MELRPWEARDAEVVRHWHRPGHAWHRLNGPYFDAPTNASADEVADRIRDRVAAGQTDGGKRFVPVAEVGGERRVLGTVNRYALDSTGWTAVGVVLWDERHWGRGLGTEALGLWVELLFESEPALHRLDLRTWSGNVGMMRVAERLGFTLEARFREAREVEGVRYDGLGYGILRSEWSARQ
ncbi:MAG: GNAT family N-acetyltransferase [Alphaproteobacteria bacterium]|nr:GNAT family N-acetyltransferase [Alphaproteobacteria bacterium]MCB9696662.1 GNAT family N-acetyltransferase [Alphaproteobacteria bacterium]